MLHPLQEAVHGAFKFRHSLSERGDVPMEAEMGAENAGTHGEHADADGYDGPELWCHVASLALSLSDGQAAAGGG